MPGLARLPGQRLTRGGRRVRPGRETPAALDHRGGAHGRPRRRFCMWRSAHTGSGMRPRPTPGRPSTAESRDAPPRAARTPGPRRQDTRGRRRTAGHREELHRVVHRMRPVVAFTTTARDPAPSLDASHQRIRSRITRIDAVPPDRAPNTRIAWRSCEARKRAGWSPAARRGRDAMRPSPPQRPPEPPGGAQRSRAGRAGVASIDADGVIDDLDGPRAHGPHTTPARGSRRGHRLCRGRGHSTTVDATACSSALPRRRRSPSPPAAPPPAPGGPGSVSPPAALVAPGDRDAPGARVVKDHRANVLQSLAPAAVLPRGDGAIVIHVQVLRAPGEAPVAQRWRNPPAGIVPVDAAEQRGPPRGRTGGVDRAASPRDERGAPVRLGGDIRREEHQLQPLPLRVMAEGGERAGQHPVARESTSRMMAPARARTRTPRRGDCDAAGLGQHRHAAPCPPPRKQRSTPTASRQSSLFAQSASSRSSVPPRRARAAPRGHGWPRCRRSSHATLRDSMSARRPSGSAYGQKCADPLLKATRAQPASSGPGRAPRWGTAPRPHRRRCRDRAPTRAAAAGAFGRPRLGDHSVASIARPDANPRPLFRGGQCMHLPMPPNRTREYAPAHRVLRPQARTRRSPHRGQGLQRWHSWTSRPTSRATLSAPALSRNGPCHTARRRARLRWGTWQGPPAWWNRPPSGVGLSSLT